MSLDKYHHWIIEHLWRLLRNLLLVCATSVWLFGPIGLEGLILGLVLMAGLLDQFHGFICNRLERMLHWKEDFKDWE